MKLTPVDIFIRNRRRQRSAIFGGGNYAFFAVRTIVGMYNYVQPIVATILAVAIGVGRFGWREMLSMALVFGGVYIVNRAKNFERARGNK